MAAPLALAVALLAALTPSGSAQGSCFPYSGVCSSVLGSSFSTFQPSQAAFDIAKNNASFAIDQVNIIKNLNPDCYNLYLNYTCSLYFPPCVNNQPVYQCKALCTATTKSCTQLFTLGGYADKLPKCVTLDYPTPPGISYTDTNCFNPAGSAAAGTGSAPSPTSSPSPSSGTGTSSSVTCPKPLIPNPFNRTDNLPYTCPGGQCCFPCPIYHALLPPSPGAAYYERIVMILELIGAPLLVVTFILIATRPHAFKESRYVTILFSIINNFVLIIVAGSLIANGVEKYMCDSPVEDSVNKPLCTFQGFTYNFFALAFAWSEALFNINLFATLFFLRDPIPYKRVYQICGFFWVAAAVLTIVPYAKSGSVHYFASYCTPGDLSLYRAMGIYPLLVAVLISIGLGVINCLIILKMWIDILRGDERYAVAGRSEKGKDGESGSSLDAGSSKWSGTTGNPRMDTFVLGWRPALLSLVIGIGFLMFVIWWFTDAEPKMYASAGGSLVSGATAWGNEWIACLFANSPDGHAACAHIPGEHIPKEAWTEMTEIMAACPGIFYFITLGTNINDWKRVIGYLRGRRSTEDSARPTKSSAATDEGSTASLVEDETMVPKEEDNNAGETPAEK